MVAVSADTRRYQAEMERVSRMGASYGKTMQQAGNDAGRGWDRNTAAARNNATAMQASTQAVARYAAVVASAFGAGEIIRMADAWTGLNNRLRLVTDGQAEFSEAQANVLRIAQETRQPLDATAELYQRIAQNQEALQLSGQGVADVVSTISKAMVVSGTSAQAAEAALVQLGQAFASGVLRGEELNAVMEQAPGLARAIADGLGVPIGTLREMGKAGELTAAQVIAALQKQSGAVDEAFGGMDATISQAMTNLRTSLQIFVGQSDDVAGASSAIAGAIGVVARNMEAIATIGGAAALGALAGKMVQMGQAAAAAAVGMVQSRLAAVAETVAIRDATAAGLAKAQADLRRAQAAMGATRGTSASATASRNYAAALLAERQAALAAAQAQANYQRATSASAMAGRAALGLLGGPAGLAITVGMVAAGWLMFRDSTDAAASALDNWTGSADEAVAKFRELNAEQQRGAILNLEDSIGAGLRAVNDQIDQLAADVSNLGAGGAVWDNFITGVEQLRTGLATGKITADEFSRGISALNDEVVTAVGGGSDLARQLDLAEAAMATAAREVDVGRDRLERFNTENSTAAAQANATAGAIRGQAGALEVLAAAAEGAGKRITAGLLSLPGQIERLGKSAEGVARLDVRDWIMGEAQAQGITSHDDPRFKALVEQGERYIALQVELDAGQKRLAASTREANRARKEAQESDADAHMRELNEGYAQQVQSLERQIALHGDVGRAAAMAYDLANGSLSGLAEAQKDYLQDTAKWLDQLDDMSALEGVWEEIRREHKEYSGSATEQIDRMTVFAEQAGRNLQNYLGDSLYNVLSGNFDGIADRFVDMINRMTAELLASQLLEMMASAFGGGEGGGGFWGTLFGAAAGASGSGGGKKNTRTKGKRAGGGQVEPFSAYDVTEHGDPELLQVGGRHILMTGSKGGMVSPLMQADRGGGGGTPRIQVSIENKGEPMQIGSASAERAPDGTLILRLVTASMRKAFANGEMDDLMLSYGVQRRGISSG